MSVPEKWFSAVIADGLQRLAAMRLQNAPADEGLELACAIWIDTLWNRRAWQEATDPDRLRQGFTALAGHARRWPAPADLLDHLPSRPQLPALPRPQPTRTGAAHLSAMKALIAKAWHPLPGTDHRRS